MHIKWSPKLFIVLLVVVFIAISIFLRVYYPFDKVFVGEWIKYTGNDAYYQMRLVDSMANNGLSLTAFDPYFIYPGGGTYSPVHFFNTLLAFVIWIGTAGSPTPLAIDMIAVYFPVILAALAIIPVYFMGKSLFGRWAGLIAAGMIAVLPGEFLGRSILGGTDQHVYETLVTAVLAMFVIFALRAGWQSQLTWGHITKFDWKVIWKPLLYSLLAGLFMGVYLISWIGGLLFVFIITVYLVLQFVVDRFKGQNSFYLAFTGFFIFLIAFLIYQPVAGGGFQTLALVIAILIPPALAAVSGVMAGRKLHAFYFPVALVVFAVAFLLIFNAVKPDLLQTMLGQFVIFNPGGPTGTTTIEMQPFLSPQGSFSTVVAWGNFTTSFFLIKDWPIPGIGFVSLIVLAVIFVKRRSDEKHLLFFLVWTVIMLIATLTQRRFAYYFVVNIALLSSYLAWQAIWFFSKRRFKLQNPETLTEQYRWARLVGITCGIIIYFSCIFLYDTKYFFFPALVLANLSLFYGFWAWVKMKGKNDYMILWAFLFPIGVLVLAFSADETAKARVKAKVKGKEPPLNLQLYRFNIAALVVIVVLALFWPNYDVARGVAAAATYAPSNAWEETMHWLKDNTPAPLEPDGYYKNYDASFTYPDTVYGVTAWWDYGYWITRTAHRIPSANPSQNPAPIQAIANLFLSQDEEQAGQIVASLDSSYIVLDDAITFSKLWAVATWAGKDISDYIQTYYHQDSSGQVQPVQVFTPEYYSLLCVRLYNFDGKASTGEKPIVITYENRTASGKNVRLVTNAQQFDSYQEALVFVNSQESTNVVIASSNPYSNPVPLEAVPGFELVFSSTMNSATAEGNGIAEVKTFRYTGE